MQKTLLSIIITSAIGISIFVVPSAQAATQKSPSPTPSPSSKASPSSEAKSSTTSLLKERIDKVIEQRKEQVKGVIDQLGSQKRGVVGEVQRVTEKTISIKNYNGTEVLNLTTEVSITRDGKKASLKDIAVGDWIVAMGYGTNSSFRLLRIMASSTSLQPKPLITAIATLQTISATQAVFIPRTTSASETPPTLVMGLNAKTTVFQDSDGNPIDRKTLKTENQYIVVGFEDKNTKTALIIHALAPTSPSDTNATSTKKP